MQINSSSHISYNLAAVLWEQLQRSTLTLVCDSISRAYRIPATPVSCRWVPLRKARELGTAFLIRTINPEGRQISASTFLTNLLVLPCYGEKIFSTGGFGKLFFLYIYLPLLRQGVRATWEKALHGIGLESWREREKKNVVSNIQSARMQMQKYSQLDPFEKAQERLP